MMASETSSMSLGSMSTNISEVGRVADDYSLPTTSSSSHMSPAMVSFASLSTADRSNPPVAASYPLADPRIKEMEDLYNDLTLKRGKVESMAMKRIAEEVDENEKQVYSDSFEPPRTVVTFESSSTTSDEKMAGVDFIVGENDFSPQRIMAVVEASTTPIPEAHRRALVESIRLSSTNAKVVEILLDFASNSLYLTAEHKTQIANALLHRDIQRFQTLLECPSTLSPSTTYTTEPPDVAFCTMARLILSHSPKVQALPSEQRRRITKGFRGSTTVFLEQLSEIRSLSDQERQLVASDVVEHRYDRLLRPNRLGYAEQQECPVCLCHLHDAAMHHDEGSASSECPLCGSKLFHI